MGFYGTFWGNPRAFQKTPNPIGVGAWGPRVRPQMGFGVLQSDPFWGFAEDYSYPHVLGVQIWASHDKVQHLKVLGTAVDLYFSSLSSSQVRFSISDFIKFCFF